MKASRFLKRASRRRLFYNFGEIRTQISIEKQTRASVKDCFKKVKKRSKIQGHFMEFISLILTHERSEW